MAKAIAGIIVIFLTMGSFGPVLAGDWTSHGFVYKPSPGARGTVEKGLYDSGQNRVDARLSKEIWVGDPNYGTTIQGALTAISSTPAILRVPAGTHSVSANLIVPSNVTLKVERGATLAIPQGIILTINGGLEAGLYQIFICTGTGKVVFGSGAVKAVLPQWFGAKADGVTDDSATFQQAFDSLPLHATHGWSFLIPPGDYYIPSTVNLPMISLDYSGYNMAPCYIIGYGATLFTDQHNTILKRWPTNDTTDPNAYAQTAYVIDGIQFKGTSLRDQIGLDLACTYGSRIMNCRFALLGRGLRLSYAMLAEVTECLANGCEVAGFTETDGYGLWSTNHTWLSTTCRYRHCRVYPATALTPVSIEAMTPNNPCVVTWTGHGLKTGDIVFIDGITQLNWTALNHRRFQITRINADSFSLYLLNRTDSPAGMNTSTFGAYVPSTGGGVIHAARFGFQFINACGPTLESCYIDGGTITDSIFYYHYGYYGPSIVGNLAEELTPLGAGLYLNNIGAAVSLDGFGGSGVTLDMFDIGVSVAGLVTMNNYSPDNGKIRLPGDNSSANYRIAFKGGGILGTGREMFNPVYWYQGTVPFRISNYSDDGNPRIQGGSVLLEGGRGTFITQEPYYGTAYYAGAYYQGLRSEANTAGGGGVGAYDPTNGQAIMVKQKSTEVTVTAGATNTVTNFIPAGVMVVGFTVRVTEAIAGPTSFTIGDGTTANKFGTGILVAKDTTGTLANMPATASPTIYPAATNVVLTATGGTFTGGAGNGKVRITVHYITLEAPGS